MNKETKTEKDLNLDNYNSSSAGSIGSSLVISLAIIIAGIIVAIAVVMTQGDPNLNIDTEQPEFSLEDISFDLEGWPSKGDIDAPVVIVGYSDYACPFCGRFALETLPQITENYIETGKVRFVFKDFIIVGGDRAAEAAHCSGDQGKYWEYHDLIFERLDQDRSRLSSLELHQGYANELDLDIDEFTECFQDRRYQQKAATSTQEALNNGGTGTPFFLINGYPVSGAQPFALFQEAIESFLD